MSKIGITSLGEDRFEIDLSGADGKSLTELLADKNLDIQGQSIVVNGTRLPDGAASSYVPRSGDEVSVMTKSKGGAQR